MAKKLKGFRFSEDLYTKFKAVTESSGLMVTEAFEEFMEACVELGAVKFPESADRKRDAEAEARILLTWLRSGRKYYSSGDESETHSVPTQLLQLLPRIDDAALRADVEAELKSRRAIQ